MTHELAAFNFTRVLNEDPILKTLTLLGTLPSPTAVNGEANTQESAILIIERSAFPVQTATGHVAQRIATLATLGKNDIYSWWTAILAQSQLEPDLKISVIHPATEAHIVKYSKQERKMVTETAEIYRARVLPWIENQPKSRIQWVYNILNGSKEQDDILFRDNDPDTGFIVLPDSKWDRKTLSSLYLLAISMRSDVRSMRDLTTKHLPMLKNIREKALKMVPEKFPGVASDEVRLFVHYHPSYYHFHVHITHVQAQVPGSTVGQSHLLENIIDNIEHIDPDYYSKINLRFALGVNHPVYALVTGELSN
ncbi:hypothetical protein DFQ27_004693 [Actinomortierella ambigua]|uniref:m7GpppX diphosphatase n=1 Tax=Actinomortierella ambigua TaxID=1343610 RepID=A0A9P6U3Q3_9FUNG|nr:hypothetical protein DFQ27_004693 [Actinomortierella ambigua]